MTGAGDPAQLLIGVTSTRVRALGPAARVLRRAILHAFAATGRAPDPATLPVPEGHHRRVLLRELRPNCNIGHVMSTPWRQDDRLRIVPT